jgi:hypothetical protein
MRRVPGYPGLYREMVGRHGTRYRIAICRNRKRIQQYLSFGRKWTKAGARAKAIRQWKAIRDSLPVITRAAFAQIERRKSRSGIVGVRRITKKLKVRRYPFWVAVFSDRRGRKQWRSFSIDKYGEDRAKRLARKARREGLARMEG